MEEKQLYVTLDPLTPGRDGGGMVLTKSMPEEYINKSVYEVIERVLDPRKDELNQVYNALETETAEMVKQWFADMNRDPQNFKLGILAYDANATEVPLNLDEKLSHYESSGIFKNLELDQNSDKAGYVVDMAISRGYEGGISLDSLVERR